MTINQPITTPVTEPVTQTQVTATTPPTAPVTPVVPAAQPSIADLIALIAKEGNETLLQLAPIQELVQTARKQEKDKLYKSIEQKEAEAKQFKDQLLAAQDSLKKFETDNLSFEDRLKAELDQIKKDHDLLVSTLQAEKEQAEKAARQKALEAYQAKQLRAAGEELILELVGGNSEEEIDRSIELAKEKYQEIASKFAGQQQAQTVQAVKDTFVATAPPSSAVQTLTMEEVRKMSPEEYAKNRPLIMELIRSGQIQ
jgi:septal ring factor EnvC (AmiA/AmiB activator)